MCVLSYLFGRHSNPFGVTQEEVNQKKIVFDTDKFRNVCCSAFVLCGKAAALLYRMSCFVSHIPTNEY